MSERAEVNNYGMGAFGLLGVIFVVCKIFEIGPIAGWSWWLVTLPFWGGIAVLAAIAGVVLLIAFAVAMLD